MAQQPRQGVPRAHGLSGPLARDQIGAMIVYPILTAGFFLLASYFLPMQWMAFILGVYGALVFVSTCCWFYVELTDPAEPGGIGCPCMTYTQGHSRYCATCRKTVPGLDHHCLWLNTCIGTRNYVFFCILAMTGTIQFGLQTVVSILLLTLWRHEGMDRRAESVPYRTLLYNAIVIAHTVLALLAFFSFFSLCAFHTYLQFMGMGTYDWILSKRSTPNQGNMTARGPPITAQSRYSQAAAAANGRTVGAPDSNGQAPRRSRDVEMGTGGSRQSVGDGRKDGGVPNGRSTPAQRVASEWETQGEVKKADTPVAEKDRQAQD